jgi:hypothetical protein
MFPVRATLTGELLNPEGQEKLVGLLRCSEQVGLIHYVLNALPSGQSTSLRSRWFIARSTAHVIVPGPQVD